MSLLILKLLLLLGYSLCLHLFLSDRLLILFLDPLFLFDQLLPLIGHLPLKLLLLFQQIILLLGQVALILCQHQHQVLYLLILLLLLPQDCLLPGLKLLLQESLLLHRYGLLLGGIGLYLPQLY